jgi:hypothetical protein
MHLNSFDHRFGDCGVFGVSEPDEDVRLVEYRIGDAEFGIGDVGRFDLKRKNPATAPLTPSG